MQLTRPPLLEMEVMSLLAFLAPGKVDKDLSPVNGATMLAGAGVARLIVVTAAEETMEEAIFASCLVLNSYTNETTAL